MQKKNIINFNQETTPIFFKFLVFFKNVIIDILIRQICSVN